MQSHQIGHRCLVPIYDYDARRDKEGDGYIIERPAGCFYIMRRIFHPGVLRLDGPPQAPVEFPDHASNHLWG